MEITAPGGNLEKIRYAVLYGADAVYCAYEQFGLRAFAGNLNRAELSEAISFCHARSVKLYLTLNIYPRNADFGALQEFIHWLDHSGVDAVIVSDPGIFDLVRSYSSIPIHISTQANTTNAHSVAFWQRLGAKRIVPARELSFYELQEIKARVPNIEIEAFVHGAMCISWSGRCLLSAALNNRSANYGECTHPCRWNWALTEESRPNEFFPVQQDQYGTYVLSSKDLCLVEEMPRLQAAGIEAAKIEGRMKSAYYVAQSTRIYKRALCMKPGDTKELGFLMSELNKISHRPYYRGFFDAFDDDSCIQSVADNKNQESAYEREWQFCAKNLHQDNQGMLHFDCISKLSVGDEIEIIFPNPDDDYCHRITEVYDAEAKLTEHTRPNFSYAIPIPQSFPQGGLIRKCIN